MSEVHVNLMVVKSKDASPSSGLNLWVEPCDTLSEKDALEQWEVNTKAGDTIVAMYELVLRDEMVAGIGCPFATTYAALEGLNVLCEEPRVKDLLMRIFALGFKAGSETKAHQLRESLEIS